MALMAVLRVSSRVEASRLDFWTKKSAISNPAKVREMTVSRSVKPCLFI